MDEDTKEYRRIQRHKVYKYTRAHKDTHTLSKYPHVVDTVVSVTV